MIVKSKKIRRIIVFLMWVGVILSACSLEKTNYAAKNRYAAMKHGFETPPDSTKPGIYWYFISGHISKEGITKDLEAMKRVGIGEVFIGDIFF